MFRRVKGPILVVDDHEDTREMVAALLVENGLVVLQASNGREALDRLIAAEEAGETVPFLILLDLEMPVMTGWEFLTTIRTYAHLSTIPVVITSGSHKACEIVLNSPIVAFLPKPAGVDLLLDTIGRLAPLAASG